MELYRILSHYTMFLYFVFNNFINDLRVNDQLEHRTNYYFSTLRKILRQLYLTNKQKLQSKIGIAENNFKFTEGKDIENKSTTAKIQ